MRHARFAIGALERERWYQHMSAAVAAVSPKPEISARLLDYFGPAADHLRNA
jgi:truncated hemoglobin YjbI